ncbi:5'-3' exonuclease [Microbacterium sp. YY-01]|uniref:5'-3' exonuclease n=1 Tax=Microbacterium sp. YY-01 TaxID=3421634 RepID=UPI003D167471
MTSSSLLLLDTASLYFRAFHGVPDRFTSPDGTPVNAARGLLDMVAKLIDEFAPSDVIACWDDSWRPAWRVALIPSYKQHRVAGVAADGSDREDAPERLEVQLPLIREAFRLLGIPVVGAPDYEADDIIGSLVAQSRMPVDIVTGDRDLFQLVNDTRCVRVINTARGMKNLDIVSEHSLVDRYGVTAAQYVDFAVLRGDASDGLPGVAGIGDKTAAALLHEFGSLEAIRQAAEQEKALSPARRAALKASSDYLDVAPRVVRVATQLSLPAVNSRLREPDDESAVLSFGEKHGLGQSMLRALSAVRAAA